VRKAFPRTYHLHERQAYVQKVRARIPVKQE